MPHLFLQALKSSISSRAHVEPLGPSPLSFATVAALSPPPPPSSIDRMGALENDLLGGNVHGINSHPDLLLFAHAVVLLVAFLVVTLLWYWETFGQKKRAKCCLIEVPQHDYSVKKRASKPSPFPFRPSQQAKKLETIEEESASIEDLQEREYRDEWCSQVYASVLASFGAPKEGTEMERIEKELEEVMASRGSHLNNWLDTRSPPGLTAASPNGLLLLACLLQDNRVVTHKKHKFGLDNTSVGSDIPELSEDMPELGENECCDMPDIIYLSDK